MSKSCCHEPGQPDWKRSRTLWSIVALAIIWVASTSLPGLEVFRGVLEHDFDVMFWPLLAGLVVGGSVDAFIPSSWIMAILSGKRKRNLIYSVGFGFLMSSCSHGLLAIAMQLYKKGASRAAVISFLLASPWANLAMTFLLIGFFKFWGIVIILGAIVIAFITGFVFQKIDQRGVLGPALEMAHQEMISVSGWWSDLRAKSFFAHVRGVARGTLNLSEMVLPWIALGVFLAAVSATVVPQEWFKSYLGPDLRGLFATLGLASVIEVCSEGMSFLAFELYKQTGAMGNAALFLMAGVATDLTEISLIWKNLGWKSAALMMVIAIPQIVLLGWLINLATT